MDLEQQDLEGIESLKTVLDVFRFLRDQGGSTYFAGWDSCLDPLCGFVVQEKDDPDSGDEPVLRKYLNQSYNIYSKTIPVQN